MTEDYHAERLRLDADQLVPRMVERTIKARDDVEKAYLKSEAERLYYEYAERLNDLAFEDPDSLEPVAEALGMEIQESDWIEREGGAGLFASPKVAGAAFSDDVLLEGQTAPTPWL